MYEGKSHTLFAKYAVPQMIGLLFNSVYMVTYNFLRTLTAG